MRDIIEDLAATEPLALRSHYLTNSYTMPVSGAAQTVVEYNPASYWICKYCYAEQEAKVDNYWGYTESHTGDFPHEATCIWKRAHAILASPVATDAS